MTKRKLLKTKFWPPYLNLEESNLYEDELGWQEMDYEEEEIRDTYMVYDRLVVQGGLGLLLYYVEKDILYYFDVAHGQTRTLPLNPKWDGKYLFEKYDNQMCYDQEQESIFDYEDAMDLWNRFQVDGHDMRYLIEHSIVGVMQRQDSITKATRLPIYPSIPSRSSDCGGRPSAATAPPSFLRRPV